jgi:NAD(P)-dependent dehydrogenase (short-subunit alcohol dehydrogenase family)
MRAEHALVVGAGGAFGTEIVRRLAREGLHVVGISRSLASLDALADELGKAFQPVAADIAGDDAIASIASALSLPVAMVVHAPGLPVAGGIRQASPDVLAAACNIKVGGMLRLVRAAEPRLRRGSRLVAIGGHYGFEPTDYAATAGIANAAVANLIRQLSWAYGKDGVTAHLVAPGPADTDRLRNVAAARAARSGRDLEAELDEMRHESAIGSFVDAAQVAWGVATLLAPEADAMAGSTLFLDAGRRRGLP